MCGTAEQARKTHSADRTFECREASFERSAGGSGCGTRAAGRGLEAACKVSGKKKPIRTPDEGGKHGTAHIWAYGPSRRMQQ